MWFCEQDYLKSQGFGEELYSAWKRGTGEKLMIHPMNYNIFNFTVRCALLLRQFALWSCVTLKWLGLFYSRGWCCCIYVSQISWINEYWLNDDLIDWLIGSTKVYGFSHMNFIEMALIVFHCAFVVKMSFKQDVTCFINTAE